MGDKCLFFNSRDELIRVNVKQVAFFEADGNYCNIVQLDGTHGTVCISLAQMLEYIATILKGEKSFFMRVGKKYIINMNHVYHVNMKQQQLILADGLHKPLTIKMSKEALRKTKDLFVGQIKN